jgi:hypothetical protein
MRWDFIAHFVWQVENYRDELEEMKGMTRQESVAHLRRSVLCVHVHHNNLASSMLKVA